MTTPEALRANVQSVTAEIAGACARAGRNPAEVVLIAVSKTQPVELVAQVMATGVCHFGENRIEEAQNKIATLAPRPIWHMIGHVQSRKARAVAEWCDWVHSVDSLKLAQKLAEHARAHSKALSVLIEVNVSGEESKAGFDAVGWAQNHTTREALWRDFDAICQLEGLYVQGLMTVAPYYETAEEARWVFREVAQLRAQWVQSTGGAMPHLSMGMTNDYTVAIEEGATFVRVGRAIFGER